MTYSDPRRQRQHEPPNNETEPDEDLGLQQAAEKTRATELGDIEAVEKDMGEKVEKT